MKKMLAILLTIATLCVMGGWANPKTNSDEGEYSLIKYLETHEVDSYAEFQEVIRSVSPESVDDIDPDSVTDFSIDIDYDNRVVSVTTIGESIITSTDTSNTASQSYYNDLSIKIFTISVTGKFRYSTGSCTTLTASGSFSKPFYSTWTSTPTISSGNLSPSVAYARISGTATSGSSSISYSLRLTCNDSGQFGTTT